jgi:hypothetical protein
MAAGNILAQIFLAASKGAPDDLCIAATAHFFERLQAKLQRNRYLTPWLRRERVNS